MTSKPWEDMNAVSVSWANLVRMGISRVSNRSNEWVQWGLTAPQTGVRDGLGEVLVSDALMGVFRTYREWRD